MFHHLMFAVVHLSIILFSLLKGYTLVSPLLAGTKFSVFKIHDLVGINFSKFII